MKIKKLLFGSCAVIASVGFLTACNTNSATKTDQTIESATAQKEYINESQINDLFTSPNNFKDKYVKISGQVFTEPEKDGDTWVLQCWNNPEKASNNFIVYVKDTETQYKNGDYILVDGKIEGEFKGENMFGSTLTLPLVNADSVEVSSYVEVEVPTKKTITPENSSVSQKGITLSVDKIEFADTETRVYMTEKNDTKKNFNLSVYDIKIIQDGKQISEDNTSNSSYLGNYKSLSYELAPGTYDDGVVVFPKIDDTKEFKIYAEGYSADYDLQLEPFEITIKP